MLGLPSPCIAELSPVELCTNNLRQARITRKLFLLNGGPDGPAIPMTMIRSQSYPIRKLSKDAEFVIAFWAVHYCPQRGSCGR